MATKTIAIMTDVYDLLKGLQKPGESFSEEIRRLCGGKRPLTDFAGAWNDVGDKESKEMFAAIKKMREQSHQNLLKKVGCK